ncbi:PilZ domain-containing protein [bacterium]|nr:PilZ domain-containing protein [bacterium]
MTRIAPGLEQLMDPNQLTFYLTLGTVIHEIPIRRVGMDFLILDFSPQLKGMDYVKGYVVAKDGRGIIPIECKLTLEKTDDGKIDILMLKMNPADLKLVNQREFYRLANAARDKATVLSAEGQSYTVDIINISAGGVGFTTSEFLSSAPVYQITFPLWNTETKINLAIKVVFYKKKKNANDPCYHGAQFIKNQSLTSFPVLTKNDQEKIIQSINRRLLDLRKIKDD